MDDSSPTLPDDGNVGGSVNPLRMSLPSGLRPPPAQRGGGEEEDASPMRSVGSSPRRIEVGGGPGGASALSLARSPLDAHSSNREDDSGWSPSMLLRSTPLVVLSCLLVALAVVNLVIGLGGGGGHECFDLAAFLIWSAVVSAATLPAIHVLAAASRTQRRERMLRIAGGGPAEDPAESEAASAAGGGGGGGGILGGILARLLRLSLPSTIRLALLSLLLLSALYSFWVIDWLASGACGANRSVRQMALGDVMLFFAALALVALDLIIPRLPARVTRQLTRNGGKAFAMLVVLSALIANIAQLESHDVDWIDGFHWSYSTRDPPCPRSCLGAPSSALRSIVCLNSAGEQVAKAHCEHLGFHGYTHPTLQVAMLKECDALPFDACKAEYAQFHHGPPGGAATVPAPDSEGPPRAAGASTAAPKSESSPKAAGASTTAPKSEGVPKAAGATTASATTPIPSDPASRFPSNGELRRPRLQAKSDPECPRECVVYPEDYTFPGDQDWLRTEIGCWLETEYIRQMDTGVPESQADGWVEMEQCAQFTKWATANTQACPPRPCPSFCDPLEAASLIYVGLYFFLLLLLCFSIFYARLVRLACFQRALEATGVSGWSSYRATPSVGAAAAAEEDETIRIPASALVTPQFTVDDEGGAQDEQKHEVPPPLRSPAAVAAAAPVASAADSGSVASGLPSVSRTLVLGFRALFLSPDGWRPWWRHILFLACSLALGGWSVYAVLTLFWLLQAHCRDFIISAVLNAGLTCMAGLILLALAFQRREVIARRDTNPFESIGLLDEGVDSMGNGGGDDGEDQAEDIEFGLSQSTLSSRTRRELENEPSSSI